MLFRSCRAKTEYRTKHADHTRYDFRSVLRSMQYIEPDIFSYPGNGYDLQLVVECYHRDNQFGPGQQCDNCQLRIGLFNGNIVSNSEQWLRNQSGTNLNGTCSTSGTSDCHRPGNGLCQSVWGRLFHSSSGIGNKLHLGSSNRGHDI